MKLLSPAWLALGLLSLPILLLYMLKLRRKQVEVSSNMLWQMLLRDRQANAPWQRLKRNLLLFLQLLILAALVFALARPAVAVPSVASGPLVVLLDGSASMNATDIAPNRFEAAKEAIRDLIEHLGSNARMSLILVANQPQVLAAASQDAQSLLRALSEAQPSQGSANWEAAFALAAGAASASGSASSTEATIVIVSDGGLPKQGLPPLPGEVRYIPIGASSQNLGFSAFSLRTTPDGKAELFVQVQNYGSTSQAVVLSLYQDGKLFQSQSITIPAGQSTSQVVSGLATQIARYEARLLPSGADQKQVDAFPLDNQAYAVYSPPLEKRTLLVSPGNLFLEQVLAALPNLTAYRALLGPDGKAQLPNDRFDLYVLDGVIPDPLPTGNLLLVNPPESPLFSVTGVFSDTAPAQVAELSTTRYLSWENVHVRQARSVKLPIWATQLVQAPGGPLVFVGETGGRKVAVITFDLHDSDLPLQVTFPILINNLIDYLSPAQAFNAPDSLQPGKALSIMPGPDVGQVMITKPDGKIETFIPGNQGVNFLDTGQTGFYEVQYQGQANRPPDTFAVNLFDSNESSIQPEAQIQVGRSSIPPAVQNQLSQREFWPWLVGAALLILMIEWYIYHQRQSLRGFLAIWNRKSNTKITIDRREI